MPIAITPPHHQFLTHYSRHGNPLSLNGLAAQAVLRSKTGRSGLQNLPFGNAKRQVLQCDMGNLDF